MAAFKSFFDCLEIYIMAPRKMIDLINDYSTQDDLGVIFVPKRDKALKGARPVTLMTMDAMKTIG